jgi:hypothetical protein
LSCDAGDQRVLAELYESIGELSDNPVDYADPSQAIPLPFPSKNVVPPRFDLSGDGLFSYIGREKFTIIWETWLKIKADTRHRQAIYVYGTKGYGKSHILAALACLLVRKKELVVYLPDCCAMLREPLKYLRNALLFAFVGLSSFDYREWICECEDIEGLANFCMQYKQGQLCFIIDQLNALDPEPKGEDDVSDDRKFTLAAHIGWPRIDHKRLGKSQECHAYGSKRYWRPKNLFAGRHDDGEGAILCCYIDSLSDHRRKCLLGGRCLPQTLLLSVN